MTKQKPLWRCPKCGHRFVTRNLWHSCRRYRLVDHFTGKPPALRNSIDSALEGLLQEAYVEHARTPTR
jgi:hypothetical protein